MKLALFGATGTVGSALLPRLLDAGYEVRALARTPAKIDRPHPRLRIIQGNANDLFAVTETVSGCDAVLTSLGGLRDPDSISQGTANIMTTMQTLGIRRLIVMQGYHLTFPGDPSNVGRKLILPILKIMSRHLIEHSRAMATAIQTSDLDWTVIRAPRVTTGSSTPGYRTGTLRLAPWNHITNTDLADFMLTCLTDPTYIHQAPMIAAQ
jgi:putative NADH-flavin reductase